MIQISTDEIKDISDFEKHEVTLERLIMKMDDSVICLLNILGKRYLYDANMIEGTMFSYIRANCYENSFTPTVYHSFIQTMKSLNYKLIETLIEQKDGDVFYASCKWDRKDKPMYQKCSLGDALLYSLIEQKPCYIYQNIIDSLDEFDVSELGEDF